MKHVIFFQTSQHAFSFSCTVPLEKSQNNALNNCMAIDYTATIPWNDPYNPWPVYTQILATVYNAETEQVVNSSVYTLSAFDPSQVFVHNVNILPVAMSMLYASEEGALLWYSTSALPAEAGLPETIENYWFLYDLNLPNIAYKNNVARGNPFKYNFGLDVTEGWTQGAGNISYTTIVPVLSSVAPWELRRKRLLEYI